MYIFYAVAIIFPENKGKFRHFTLTKSPLTKDDLRQFGLKLANLFLSRRFSQVVNVFSLCGYYPPFEKCMALYLEKLESPLPKNTPLCQVKLKLAQQFLRRWFLKVIHEYKFLSCCNYLSLEKRQSPSFDLNYAAQLTHAIRGRGLVW